MMRLKSDLIALCDAALDGKLNSCSVEWDPRVALGVVMAAGGYPDNYVKGDTINGLPQLIDINPDSKVFHAGTAMKNGNVVTAGGRVLCVVSLGDTVAQAQQKVYKLVRQITWNNVYYRTDIGHRAIARETTTTKN
jgi:phosphoribosylamine--glycine ligase